MGIKSTRLSNLLWMFAAIDPDLYDRLLRAAYVQPIRPDEKIVCQGELDDTMFIVASGAVRVVREDGHGADEIARLGPGDLFGEMAAIEPGPRSATVEAVGYGQVLRFDAGHIRELLERYPAFQAHLRRTSVRRRQANLGLPVAA